jgi:DinB family protein
MRTIQRDLYKQLREESIASRERIASMVRPIDAARLNEHPEPNGWSVAQVLEHLCKANELYERPMTVLLSRTPRDAGAANREWKSSLVGGFIAESLLNPKPLKRGPRAFRPGPTPRNGVVEAFHDGELRFAQALDDGVSYDWRAVRIGSPALPSWAPKMNLGDGFRIHVVHVTRHARQIERLVGMLKSRH